MRHRASFPEQKAGPRLARHDLALYWGYVQGADPRVLHATYFPDHELGDLRHVRARAREIATRLAAAARQTERPDLSGLFERDPESITQGPTSSAPTLEEFREEVDPDGFHSEAELMALWTERHGTGQGGAIDKHVRAEQRRARLRARIREALAWVESHVVPTPEPAHRLDAWLPKVYTQRLGTVGLVTLADLCAHINAHGSGWYRKVRGIGSAKAHGIEEWIRQHSQPDGIGLGATAAWSPRRLASVGVDAEPAGAVLLPLERLALPPALDGSAGRYRADAALCTLGATHDVDAVRAWISTKASEHTRRAYTREAERLLLWCWWHLRKPMSSMTLEDCQLFQNFLRDPQPRTQWCGPRGTPRWSRAWRPFEGPLAGGAEHQAMVILKSLGAWLRDQNYLVANPWAGIALQAARSSRSLDKSRSFTPAQWSLLAGHLEQLDDRGARPRLKFALWLLYSTGIRLSEAVGGRLEDLRRVHLSDGSTAWRLRVRGKGGRERDVPVATEVMRRLEVYLARRDIREMAFADPRTTLLARACDEKRPLPFELEYEATTPLTGGTLYRQVQAFCRYVAKRCEREDPATAASLRRASTHWLRHTFGTQIAALTHDVVLARDILGHASLNTTSVYLDGNEIHQHQAVERLLDQQQPQRK